MEALTAVSGRGAHRLRHVQGGRSRHAHRPTSACVHKAAAGPASSTAELMISVEEALARILAGLRAVGDREGGAVDGALGRVLAEDLAARRDQPPAAVSAMDGYAVRAADVAGGRRRCRLVGRRRPGGRFDGHASAPARRCASSPARLLPAGADAVVAAGERDAADGDASGSRAGSSPARYVRPRRARLQAGRARPAGRPAADARATSASRPRSNQAWLPVRRRPRVALLATGDELVMPGETAGRRARSSAPTPRPGALVAPGAARRRSRASPATSRRTLARGRATRIAGADLLVTTGGASVGEHDLVRSVLGEQGLELDFWQIAMRPGKPLDVRRLGGDAAARPARAIRCRLRSAPSSFLRAAIARAARPRPGAAARSRRVLGRGLRAERPAPGVSAGARSSGAPTAGWSRSPPSSRTARCSRPSLAPTA